MKTLFTAVLLTVALIVLGVSATVKHYNIMKDVGSWIKLAADAPSPEKADEFLGRAISGIERRGLRDGNSALIFHTPEADIGIWVGQIRAAKSMIEDLKSSGASGLEETNALMKFRETLLDDGADGVEITSPPHLAFYPYQVLWMWATILLVVGFVASWLAVMVEFS